MRNLVVLPLVGLGLTGAVLLGATGSDAAPAPAAKPGPLVFRADVPVQKIKVWDHHDQHPYSLSESYSSGDHGAHDIWSLHQIGTEVPGNGAMTTATMRVKGGRIVYVGSTFDMDEATYAIVGGTGRFVGAAGTVALHALDRSTVRVTATVTSRS